MGNETPVVDDIHNAPPATEPAAVSVSHRVRKSAQLGRPEKESFPWNLSPLTPQYEPTEHEKYFSALDEAIRNPNIRNIALAGGYGTGKSSILQQFTAKHRERVIEIALSTLVIDTSTTPPTNHKAAKRGSRADKTNQIEREIVKQLLYQEDPRKTPGSRFARIKGFGWLSNSFIAALVGFILAVGGALTGWSERVLSAFIHYQPWFSGAVWAGFSIVTFVGLRVAFGRVHVKALSTGSATVTLGSKSGSYFDRYLDEIVYFFQSSKKDIVVFEDIDRFDDPYIFDALRSLNTLLNACPQVGPRRTIRHPFCRCHSGVRFIYAMKDSIFDNGRLGSPARPEKSIPDEDESHGSYDSGARPPVAGNPPLSKVEDITISSTALASRTKFFELIIPVVPFISHQNTPDLMRKVLSDITDALSPELLDLTAHYVPDMRMLKQARNEFVVYRDLLHCDGSGDGFLGLTPDHLFAVMLYKCTHLADFEKIGLGDSRLDLLYRIYRELIDENIAIQGKTLASLAAQHPSLALERAEQLGERLQRMLEASVGNPGVPLKYFSQDQPLTPMDLCTPEFWLAFADARTAELIVESGTQSFTLRRSQIETLLDTQCDSNRWISQSRETITAQTEASKRAIATLRSASMQTLILTSEFRVTKGGVPQTLNEIARNTLGDELAYQLVRSGYLDRDFALYTATFHGLRVTAPAMNFLIHHLQPDVMDSHFLLEPKDIGDVLRECGGSGGLARPGAYNIDIVDHLLRTRDVHWDGLARSLSSLDEDAVKFLPDYLREGQYQAAFIDAFVNVCPQFLGFLSDDRRTPDATRMPLISVALSSITMEHVEDAVDDAVAGILRSNQASLEVLASPDTTAQQAHVISHAFKVAGVLIEDLNRLSQHVLEAFAADSQYKITRANLTAALHAKCDAPLALDHIKATNDIVYRYILDHLSDYLLLLEHDSPTVESKSGFTEVLHDVVDIEPAVVASIIRRAAPSCVVQDVTMVPPKLWAQLALTNRFHTNITNLDTYLRTVSDGKIDQSLSVLLLANRSILQSEDDDESQKRRLADAILKTLEFIPSNMDCLSLVQSLHLQNPLDAQDLPTERIDLVPTLLADGLVEDCPETYETLEGAPWSVREAYIVASSKFASYIGPDLVEKDTTNILSSGIIDVKIKTRILADIEDYTETDAALDLAEVAKQANAAKQSVPLRTVRQMVSSGVAAEEVIPLLVVHLKDISLATLHELLNQLGDPYSQLTLPGHERPVVPNTEPNHLLLEHLKTSGCVSSYKARHEDRDFQVFKRRK